MPNNQSTLTIFADKTLTVQGGTIQKSTKDGYTGEVVPQIVLNGTLKLDKVVTEGDSPTTKYPTLKDVEITADANAEGNPPKLLDMDSVRRLGDDIREDGEDIIWQQNPPLNTVELLDNYIANVSIAGGVNVKLPFNCSFGQTNNVANFDLKDAARVDYTYVDAEDIKDNAGPGNIKGSVGNTPISGINDLKEKVIDEYRAKYGDYAEDATLGVSLPKKDDKVDFYDPDDNTTGKVHARRIGVTTDFTLSNVVIDHNTSGKYLNTDAFDKEPKPEGSNVNADTHELTGNQMYNFGFAGTHPVSITGNYTATFSGDNQYYQPKTLNDQEEEVDAMINLPSEVEFAGENSLFPFSQNYGKGTFKAGEYTNTVPAGKTATFTQGFSLEEGHKLIVNGTLIG